jgi:dTDP-4-dehydrorhamnose reductase
VARILVTGSRGLLGSAVVARARTQGWDVIAATREDADVRDSAQVHALTVRARPQAVVHCAYVQDGPAADETIVAGSRHVARAAAEAGARLIHVSSDRVFAGRAEAYTEDDEPDPIDPYGAAKAGAEEQVAAACPGAVVVRTSLLWRLDPPSELVRTVVDAVEGRTPMAFFVDEVRAPTHVDDLAAACVALAGRAELGGPLHLAGPVAVSRHDFARGIAAALGHDPSSVRAGHQADHGAPRPPVLVLDSTRARQVLGWAPRRPPS